jgi:hypothetical protein
MRVTEKLDGKMALLYHYSGRWRVVSDVTPDASEPIVEELALPKRYGALSLSLSLRACYLRHATPELIELSVMCREDRTFKDWLTAITLHDEAEELSKRTHQAEEELRTKQREATCGPDSDSATSFAEFFWTTWNKLGYALPTTADGGEHMCFVFEVMSQRQKLVVRHWPGGQDRIALHGARDMRTLAEVDARQAAARYGWEVVREFAWRDVMDASNWEDARKRERRRRREEGREEIDDTITRIVRKLSRWSPLEHEGVVLCDANWNRLKIRYATITRTRTRTRTHTR